MSNWTKGINNPKRVYSARIKHGADDFELSDDGQQGSWCLTLGADSFLPEAGPISGSGGEGMIVVEIRSVRMPVDIDYARAYLRALVEALDEEHGR